MIKWYTEKRILRDLVPTTYNPRILTKKAYNELKKSLEKFSLAEIPVINKDNNIIAGHQRIKILSELHGLDYEIDVRTPDILLTKEEFDEYLIRSNANTGAWDFDILANEFNDIELLDWGLEVPKIDDIEVAMPELNSGDKSPFQGVSFTLSDEQAEALNEALSLVKQKDVYKYIETFGNQNSNGNALYTIVQEWVRQNK